MSVAVKHDFRPFTCLYTHFEYSFNRALIHSNIGLFYSNFLILTPFFFKSSNIEVWLNSKLIFTHIFKILVRTLSYPHSNSLLCLFIVKIFVLSQIIAIAKAVSSIYDVHFVNIDVELFRVLWIVSICSKFLTLSNLTLHYDCK